MRYSRSMLCLLLLLAAAAAPTGRGQERLDPKTRAALAERTVIVQSSETIMGHATGFVWRHHGNRVDVLTIFAPGRSQIMSPNIRVISHPHTAKEAVVDGELVAYDPDSGLAAIRVQTRSLPKPLPVSTAPIKTGAAFYIATCLSAGANRGSAAIAIAPIHLGATRTSKSLTLFQLDGEIQVGGEGGPVILPNGKVVGITYPSLPGTLRGAALPVSHFACLSAGTVGTPLGTMSRQPENSLLVRVPLLDLDEKIKSLSLYIAPQLKPEAAHPDEHGNWSLAMPDATPMPCKITRPCSVWRQTVKKLGLAPGRYRCQARAVRRDGSEVCSSPGWITISEPPAPKKEDENKAATKPHVPAVPTIDTVRCEPPKKPVPLTIVRSFDRQVDAFRFSEFTFQPLPQENQFGGQAVRRKPASSVGSAADARDAVWDDEGKSFYLLCRTRTWGHPFSILRFDRDSETSACEVALNAPVSAILHSRSGLLAVVPGRGFLLLDPQSLHLVRRVSMPGLVQLVLPSRGRYGLVLRAAKPGGPADMDGMPSTNQPVLLCGLDLSTWRTTKTYGAGHLPLPLAPDILLPIDRATGGGVSITDDGKYAVLGYHERSRRWMIVCPFRDGALRTKSAQPIKLRCRTLTPVPGGSRMLAECGGVLQDKSVRAPDGDTKAKSRLFLFDAAKPDTPGTWFWADRGAFPGGRFLTLDRAQTLRLVRADDKQEVSLPLLPPAGSGRNPLEHIVTCPRSRTVLLSRGRVWYSLGPGSPPPQAPEETTTEAPAPNSAEPEPEEPPADATPLQVETGQSLDLQWQCLLPKPERGSRFCQLAADGRTLYALSPAGTLRRLDLGTLTETAVADEGAVCVGLGLSSAGVLVAVADTGVREVRVRDPRSLRLLNKYPHTLDITGIVSCPATPIACLRTKDGHTMLMDSARGRIVQTYQKLPVPEVKTKASVATGFWHFSISSRRTTAIAPLAMTPDGTHVFAVLGGRLVRYRLEDTKLVPLAVSQEEIGNAGYVTVDQAGVYVGVMSDRPVEFPEGWQPDIAQSMTRGEVALVFDADTLHAVYQVPAGGRGNHFVFDKGGSQLVTASLSRCTPQGWSLHNSYIVPFGSTVSRLLAGADGWFLGSTRSGFYRFRFVPRAVTFREWERRQ